MTPDLSRRPGAIVAASIISGLLAVLVTLLAVGAAAQLPPLDLRDIGLLAGLLFVLGAIGAATVGVWQGWMWAQVVAGGLGLILTLGGVYLMAQTSVLARLAGVQNFGMLVLLVGAALAGTVLVPASSRDWFAYVRPKP